MQDKLLASFIFNDFTKKFREFLIIEKKEKDSLTSIFASNTIRRVNCFFTWNDPEYRLFMQYIFLSLEPIRYKKGTRITKELEEVGVINFISDGEIHVGFEINKQEIYTMRFKKFSINGAFDVTYKQRSQFLFKAGSNCKGFFIRKQAWQNILDESESQISKNLKQKILIDYLWNFRSKIVSQKNKVIGQYKGRSDFQNLLVVDSQARRNLLL